MKDLRTVVIIPARYASSRYPGKPLVELLGKPMILWVAELSAIAVGAENVYIATDDERIATTVKNANFQPIITGPALTGTDRLADAAAQIEADIIINVQGDEPLVNPEDITNIAEHKKREPNVIINGFSYLAPDERPENVNIPKVITTENDMLLYMSRLPIPGFKEESNRPQSYKKQVCIYGFSKDELKAFRDFGRKSAIEECEDIEILRFMELGVQIKMVKTRPGSYAVDSPEDVAVVERALKSKLNS